MKLKEKNEIIKWANSLSDEELEKEYYEAVYDCLGSEVDEMYERGYDFSDIAEREIYEQYLCDKSDILHSVCLGRGIELWKRS